MKTKTLDIPLKGSRDYIQGPDLFNAAFETLAAEAGGPSGDFEIAFHRMAHRQVELIWDTEDVPNNAFALGSRANNGIRARYWMREIETPLSDRQPYPEDEIVAQMRFDEALSEAYLGTAFPYSDMEVWVSMIKALHQRRFADAAGKWVFARAKLKAYELTHAPAPLRVALAATLGTKLTRNEVYLNDEKIGDVFFALM
ncbi:hypothetical protein [Roseovarius sp.]|uniref:hypothetical protein n=1 Tax=Roseovarius sp. TaxID=1486281 RepID=UPI00351693C5